MLPDLPPTSPDRRPEPDDEGGASAVQAEHAGRPGVTACSLCAGETLGGGPATDEQLARLAELARRTAARLTLAECLDRCERGDVVVVRPSRSGRHRGARPVWFERLAGDRATSDLADWLADGGPGLAPLPGVLGPLVLAEESGEGASGTP